MKTDIDRPTTYASKRVTAPAHTKIVATIGPASEERIGELIDAGMSVARINLSHGTGDDFLRRVDKIRAVAEERMAAVGILTDIQGPKMRMGRFENARRELEMGEVMTLREGKGMSMRGEVIFEFTGFQQAVLPGHRVLLADGQVEMIATDIENGVIQARVTRPGAIGDRKGVHFPDSAVNYELPTDEDRGNLELARTAGVDFIGISFVSRKEEVRAVRALCPEALMVAKIERMAALENLDDILAETDGVMVARGDLGVEAELEQLPLIQKSILAASLRAGKFTITATEMLESMIASSRPTRAEVTDVANAVLDGSDAVMLSAETAVGLYPVDAVWTMSKIARAVETSQRYRDIPRPMFRASEFTFSNAAAMAAVQAAEALRITKIVCFTETGNTVRLISRYRPSAEVIGLTPHQRVVNSMTILAHVRPFLVRRERSLEDMIAMASEMLVMRDLAQYGDPIVFVAGVPAGVAKSTNVVKLHRIGEEVRLH